MSNNGWIGVDLDGTLAQYNGWQGEDHIGEPIPAMVERIKKWLSEGTEVKIFTARVSHHPHAEDYIREWCEKHVGAVLPVTATKDYGMVELWDDRCVQVIPNTGIAVQDQLSLMKKKCECYGSICIGNCSVFPYSPLWGNCRHDENRTHKCNEEDCPKTLNRSED